MEININMLHSIVMEMANFLNGLTGGLIFSYDSWRNDTGLLTASSSSAPATLNTTATKIDGDTCGEDIVIPDDARMMLLYNVPLISSYSPLKLDDPKALADEWFNKQGTKPADFS